MKYIKDKDLLNAYIKQTNSRMEKLIQMLNRRKKILAGLKKVNANSETKDEVKERNQYRIDDLKEEIKDIEDELLFDLNIDKKQL